MPKLTILITLCITISLLAGCWSARELDDLGIAGSIGIDKVEEGYKVTVQMLNPSEIASQNQTTRLAVTSFTATGETIFEALRKLTVDAPRKVYLAHVRIVIFGEEMAKEGIKKTLDFISRDHEMRTDFFMLVAKDNTAESVLNILTPIETIPSNKLFSSLETSASYWAPTSTVTLDQLIGAITSKGRNPVLTGVELIGNKEIGNNLENVEQVPSAALLKLDGLAVFKEDKLVGWLSEEESKGYNYIQDNVKSTVGTIDCPEDGKLTVEVIRTKTNFKGRVTNGNPIIDIDLNAEMNIGEVMCKIDLSIPENIEKLEKITEDRINEVIQAAVTKAQEDFESDIFGFGEAIHRAEPKKWKEWEKNWDEGEFQNLTVQVNAEANIRRLGTITESFQKEE